MDPRIFVKDIQLIQSYLSRKSWNNFWHLTPTSSRTRARTACAGAASISSMNYKKTRCIYIQKNTDKLKPMLKTIPMKIWREEKLQLASSTFSGIWRFRANSYVVIAAWLKPELKLKLELAISEPIICWKFRFPRPRVCWLFSESSTSNRSKTLKETAYHTKVTRVSWILHHILFLWSSENKKISTVTLCTLEEEYKTKLPHELPFCRSYLSYRFCLNETELMSLWLFLINLNHALLQNYMNRLVQSSSHRIFRSVETSVY